MVDKVKPLKIEHSSLGGTEDDPFPVEADPNEDYLAAKGIAFGNDDNFLIEKIGRVILEKLQDGSQKPTYLVNGDVDYIEFFNSSTQITANRIAKVTLGYTTNNVTSETWVFYDTDGTTVLRTITLTHTYSSNDWTNTTEATT